MDWRNVLDDIEAQLDAAERVASDAEIVDQARLLLREMGWADRLRGSVGRPVRITCSGGSVVVGRLAMVGPDWALLRTEGTGEWIVSLAAVTRLDGLGLVGSPTSALSPSALRSTLDVVLRRFARERARMQVVDVEGDRLSGVAHRVGRDYLELTSTVGSGTRWVIPLPAVAVVSQAWATA
jgi:hypothetical protein